MSCIVCLKTANKDKGITLHQFPKDSEKREVWLNVCQLTESDVMSNRKICSSHFDPFYFKQSSGKLKLLTWNAVPTRMLSKPKLKDSSDNKEIRNISKVLNTDNVMTLDSTLQDISPSLIETTNLVSLDLTNQLEKQEITLHSILQNPSGQPEKDKLTILDNHSLFHVKTTNSFSSDINSHEKKEISVTPVRRKSIRYPMDVKLDDLNSPTVAKAYYHQSQLQIQTHRRKIKTLHQNINRLKKKVTSLKSFIRLLKENNVINNVAYDTILQNEEISEDNQKMLNLFKKKSSIKKSKPNRHTVNENGPSLLAQPKLNEVEFVCNENATDVSFLLRNKDHTYSLPVNIKQNSPHKSNLVTKEHLDHTYAAYQKFYKISQERYQEPLDNEWFTCTECPTAYADKKLLVNHQQSMHRIFVTSSNTTCIETKKNNHGVNCKGA